MCHGTCDVSLGESTITTKLVNSEGNDAESTEVQFTDTDEDAPRHLLASKSCPEGNIGEPLGTNFVVRVHCAC